MFNGLFVVGFDFDQEREQKSGPVKIDPYQLKDARGKPVVGVFTQWNLADAFIQRIRINWGLALRALPESSAIEFLLSNSKAGFTINPETYGTMQAVPLGDALAKLARLYYEEGVKDGMEAAKDQD